MLLERAAKLEREMTREALWEGALETFVEIGFPFVAYIMTDDDRRQLDFWANISAAYENYNPARDPFLDYCCQSYEAWRIGPEYLQDYENMPEEAVAFVKNAAEIIGCNSGFGIPMRIEGSSRFGGFLLLTSLGREAFEAEFADRFSEINGFCLLVHRRFEELGALNADALKTLTRRERDIIARIANGATRKECARELSLSPHTVAEYTKSAYRKLGVRNRAEAAKVVLSNGGR